jgi:hypothetical protein
MSDMPNRGVTGAIITETDPELLPGIVERLLAPGPGLAAIDAFERGEATLFESYGGKYVETGDLRASLTNSGAAGAVRLLTPEEFTFGTSVWYAIFQGTTGPGNKKAPSAILEPTALEAAAAAFGLKEYVLKGRRAGTLVAAA